MLYKIPLNSVQQLLDIDLSGVTYRLRFTYNKWARAWFLDIWDKDSQPLVLGTPLITGANILDQYLYKGFKGVLTLYTAGNPDLVPSLDQLGSLSKLYWIEVSTE